LLLTGALLACPAQVARPCTPGLRCTARILAAPSRPSSANLKNGSEAGTPEQEHSAGTYEPRAAAREDDHDCVPPEFCSVERCQRRRRGGFSCYRSTARAQMAACLELSEEHRRPMGRSSNRCQIRQRDERR